MNYGMDYQGGDGGGFGASQGGATPPTSAGGRPRKSYDEQTLLPVTISMCLKAVADPANTNDIHLEDGRSVHNVKLVAAVRDVEDYSTNTVYQVEDGTGLIDVKQWVDENNVCSAFTDLQEQCKHLHKYIVVCGSLRDSEGKKMILAQSIRPLKTGNELTHHFLEVVYTSEKSKQKNSYIPSHGAPMMMMQQQHHQGVGFGGGGGAPIQSYTNNSTGSGVRDAVLQYIRSEGDHNDTGADMNQCIMRLQNRFSENDIRKSIEELATEGHIYSTIDENYYKFAM